jgi:hypothetical protein
VKRICATFLLLLLCSAAFAGDAQVSWTPATDCSDGSSLENCPTTGFQIDRKLDTDTNWTPIITVSPALTTYTVKNLGPGVHQFRLITLSADKVSGPSVVASKTIDRKTPNPPSAVTAK